MDLYFSFGLFLAAMLISLLIDISMIYPLLAGFIIFVLLAIKKGFSLKEVYKMLEGSFKDSFIVIGILLLIGCLTGLWRISGTIAYFVSLGVSIIPSKIFILACFILTALMSFALGTSFGVTATAGVILMSIARAGNANLVITAGAIMSGVYIGDRGSPAASSGNLVAVLTHTNMNENVRLMAKDSFVSILICVLLYGLISFISPLKTVDTSVLGLLNTSFNMNMVLLLPAIIMVILPLLKVSIKKSMLISIVVSIVLAYFVQHESVVEIFKAMILGYNPKNVELAKMLSGGGLYSMLEVCVILLISGTFGGIFKGTGMLKNLDLLIKKVALKIGRFPANILLSIAVLGIFCNQTIGIMMQSQLNDSLYKEDENKEKMLDIEDSVVLIAGLIPWCIASSVPLAMLDAGKIALLFAFYLYLVPLFRTFKTKKKS